MCVWGGISTLRQRELRQLHERRLPADLSLPLARGARDDDTGALGSIEV